VTTVSEAAAPSTPCIRLCTLDPVTGLCLGCGRTLDEIAAWASLDEPTRRSVMSALPARLALAARADAPGRDGP
jgi:uncharacterized protein